METCVGRKARPGIFLERQGRVSGPIIEGSLKVSWARIFTAAFLAPFFPASLGPIRLDVRRLLWWMKIR